MMTPTDLKFWMVNTRRNKALASAHLGIARTTLNRYLSGKTPIPRLLELAVKNELELIYDTMDGR